MKNKYPASDITFLARSWEEIIRESDYLTSPYINKCLWLICRTYLRGRGIKMGNYQGINKHGVTSAELITLVINRVTSDSGKDIFFPTLCKYGFDNIESIQEKVIRMKHGNTEDSH